MITKHRNRSALCVRAGVKLIKIRDGTETIKDQRGNKREGNAPTLKAGNDFLWRNLEKPKTSRVSTDPIKTTSAQKEQNQDSGGNHDHEKSTLLITNNLSLLLLVWTPDTLWTFTPSYKESWKRHRPWGFIKPAPRQTWWWTLFCTLVRKELNINKSTNIKVKLNNCFRSSKSILNGEGRLRNVCPSSAFCSVGDIYSKCLLTHGLDWTVIH